MLDIFIFEDYREFVNAWIRQQNKNGHGQLRKMAIYLRIAPVTITQIFRGDRELALESAPKLSEFMKLTQLEKKYFIKLVMYSRAGSADLKEFILNELHEIKKESQSLKNRVPSEIKLSDSDLAIFHSSWMYSAVRLLSSIEELGQREQISKYLKIDLDKVDQILNFLVQKGLCKFDNGNYSMGPQRTHLPEDSPFIISRQQSWRLKASEKMNQQNKKDLFYTAPMTLSQADIPHVRNEILKFIDRVNGIVAPSKSEELVCLNIDWFKL